MTASANWLLIAAAAFSLAAVTADPVMATVAALAGGGALVAAVAGWGGPTPNPLLLAALLGLVLVAWAATQQMGTFSSWPGGYPLWMFGAAATCVLAALSSRLGTRTAVALVGLATILATSVSVLAFDWRPAVASDVYHAHVAAGEALAMGQNPYSEAVAFVSGDPFRPDDEVVYGYPYPPPVLTTYAASSVVVDPRLVSIVSWAVLATVLGVLSLRGSDRRDLYLALLVLLAAAPVWRLTVFMAWTEPLSVALFAAGLLGISKGRKWGWIVLGLAFASKQYLVFAAPLLLAFRERDGRRPGWWSISAAVAVTLFPMLFGAADYYRSVVGNALGIGFRPDTQSVSGALNALGVGLLIPLPVMVVAVAGVLYLAWRRGNRVTLPAWGTLVTAVALLLASAFPNYWLLVSALAGLSALTLTAGDYAEA